MKLTEKMLRKILELPEIKSLIYFDCDSFTCSNCPSKDLCSLGQAASKRLLFTDSYIIKRIKKLGLEEKLNIKED